MRRVVIIEDNPDNRLLFRALLAGKFECVEFADGRDALQAMGTLLPDVVLLDISLPGMDGGEVLAHMRADSEMQHIPVIAVTAHADFGDRQNYLRLGFNGFVSKPILDETLLYDAIDRVLRGVAVARV